ncbi:conserved hypothetical protein [Chloroherpeton thalassium ATCC 35110]|uniref:Uncharacterized protein n=1 Tax=Chloroherpeton thalassium (strain ATCC 35110 / GB-78) TaxID=517418 RepID=B3QT87_CHLT3|nr:hypothetical protein [Chloroherpeton thalassium]ACF14186.1 conserved hypothetical protein [Chloroherpeton thalassium ATCC 35110]
MIATTIGRTFLNTYNERFGENLSPKEFFDNVYFEYFFNHPKYMQWVTNSPFVQMKSGQKAHSLQPDERTEKLENLHKKISAGERDASIAIGFPAAEEKEFATTSGLVTDIELQIESDDLYLSWIGGGLGIGVAGGYSIFFNEPEILIKLYEGWKIYRKYLNDPSLSELRGNQINTWNGQWLNFAYGKRFRDDFDFARLHAQDVFSVNDKVIEVNTIQWNELFFNISREFPTQTFSGYVYSLGQTNKTLGFYPFYFSQAKKITDYYKILFGEQAALDDRQKYESLFGLHIKRACELGSIGLQALEPKDLRKYYGKDSNLKLIKPKIAQQKGESEEDYTVRQQKAEQKDYENLITFRTYKTWLLAMITKNKEESLQYTAEVAEALHEYREGSTKTDRKNLIQSELLAAKSKKPFLDALTTLIKDVDESKLEMFKSLRDKVHLMSAEDFGYFAVLLKFDYAYAERKRNS